jgi:hypothetical protein
MTYQTQHRRRLIIGRQTCALLRFGEFIFDMFMKRKLNGQNAAILLFGIDTAL